MKFVSDNRKANYDYEILDKYQAGIVLQGSEVKALRAGRANLKDSFVRIIQGEAFLLNAHISYLDTANPHFKPDERRARKLLLNRAEIDKLLGRVMQEGLSIVPLGIYFNDKNIAKITIALAKGKKLHDKRESLKKKELDKEANAAMKKYL